MVETPGLGDIKKIYDEDIDDRRLDRILDAIRRENINIKGILFLVNFQENRFDYSEMYLLFKYNKILFPFKNFWKYIMIIFTHYFNDPDEEKDLEEIKEVKYSYFKKAFTKILEKEQNVSNVNDIVNLKFKYYNLRWPAKKETIKFNNNRIKYELENIFNELIKKEPLEK